eukprot:4158121-Amphidinium_carterae.1
MLRNLNNIIMQGFSIPFLELHVFKKLLDEHQIRGSGQTAQQILHSLSAVEESRLPKTVKDLTLYHSNKDTS